MTAALRHHSRRDDRLPGRGLRRGATSRGDNGSSLILALVFLVVVGLLVISMAGLTAAALRSTVSFAVAQNDTTAADGAATVAIQAERTIFDPTTLNAPIPVPCTASVPVESGVAMATWCSTQWSPASLSTRVLTVSTCLTSFSAQSCGAHPFLQSIVSYDDFPSSGASSDCTPGTTAATTSTCGSQIQLLSWAFNVAPPTVTAIAPAQPTSCSGQSVTITGTGFTSPSSVWFVSKSSYSSNLVYPATNVVVANANALAATSPSIPSGSGTYYVVVRGATGSNEFGTTTTTPTWSC